MVACRTRSCAAAARGSRSRRRWPLVGLAARRGARPELPRTAPRRVGGRSCRRHRPGEAHAVRCPRACRDDPLRRRADPRAGSARAPTRAGAASGCRPRGARAAGRAAWARDRLRRARVARATRRSRCRARRARPDRRPAGRDRWRRRPVARARRRDAGRRDDGRAPTARRGDRARGGLRDRPGPARRLRGERSHAPARRVRSEHRDRRDRRRHGAACRGGGAAVRRGGGDRRRARLRTRRRLATVGRPRGSCRRAGLARVDRRATARPLARPRGRCARATRVDACLGPRAGLPALLRGGCRDLRRAPARRRRPRRIPGSTRSLGRLRRRRSVWSRHGADRLAPLRCGRSLDGAGKRRGRACDAAADRVVARGGRDRTASAGSLRGALVARRLVRGLDRVRRPRRRRLAVGADRVASRSPLAARHRRRRRRRPEASVLSASHGNRRGCRCGADACHRRLRPPADPLLGATDGSAGDVSRRRSGRRRVGRGTRGIDARRPGPTGGGRRWSVASRRGFARSRRSC